MTLREATVVCVLTPTGRGAVAVVAVDGKASAESVDRFFQAANGKRVQQQPLNRIVYGHWHSSSETSESEDLIICRRSASQLEIHCHGGSQSSAQIVGDLELVGCEIISQQDWLQLHHDCPIRAAAHEALTQATTSRTASILLDQYHGALRRELEVILELMEAQREDEALSRIEALLQFAEFGMHLTKPWQVVIAGQPNVGKSSLINALVGFERAIVFDQPGTTRDVVTVTTAIDGWPIELSDTAGLHTTDDMIESAGIELARKRLEKADLVVWVLDAREVVAHAEQSPRQLATRQASEVGVQLAEQGTLVVVNKCDLVETLLSTGDASVGTSAVSGLGVEELLNSIATRLVPEPPVADSPVLFATSQLDLLRKTEFAPGSKDIDRGRDLLRQFL